MTSSIAPWESPVNAGDPAFVPPPDFDQRGVTRFLMLVN